MIAKHHKNARDMEKGWEGNSKDKNNIARFKNVGNVFSFMIESFFLKQILQCIKLRIAEVEIHIRQK